MSDTNERKARRRRPTRAGDGHADPQPGDHPRADHRYYIPGFGPRSSDIDYDTKMRELRRALEEQYPELRTPRLARPRPSTGRYPRWFTPVEHLERLLSLDQTCFTDEDLAAGPTA